MNMDPNRWRKKNETIGLWYRAFSAQFDFSEVRTTEMTESQLKNNRHIFSGLMNERRPYCLLLSGGGGEASADGY
jgi:hypothetical protein